MKRLVTALLFCCGCASSSSAILAGGGLDDDQIIQVLRRHRADIELCIRAQQDRDPDTDATVIVSMRVAPGGVVESAQVEPEAFKPRTIGRCLIATAESWEFPPSEDEGHPTDIRFPIRISPRDAL